MFVYSSLMGGSGDALALSIASWISAFTSCKGQACNTEHVSRGTRIAAKVSHAPSLMAPSRPVLPGWLPCPLATLPLSKPCPASLRHQHMQHPPSLSP
jgi:hypothetical protein